MVVGTPGFMPPEQARDEPLTPASDIFALGATLLFAATAAGPFGSGDPGLLMVRAASGRVEKVPKSLPKPLRKRLTSMLDPRPERRPTAAALLAGYEPARNSRWPLPAAGDAPRPGVALLVGAACAVVAVGAVVVTRPGGDDEAADGRTGAPAEEPTTTVPTNGDASVGGPPGTGVETPLVDRLDAMIEPPRTQDAYPVPIAADPGSVCPRSVEVALTLSLPDGEPLRLVVLAGDVVIGENVARAGARAVVEFQPGPACGQKSLITVVVQPTSPLTEGVPYALERYDTL